MNISLVKESSIETLKDALAAALAQIPEFEGTFKGKAVTSTNPGVLPTQTDIFYITSAGGVFNNFLDSEGDPIELDGNSLTHLYYSPAVGHWVALGYNVPTLTKVTASINESLTAYGDPFSNSFIRGLPYNLFDIISPETVYSIATGEVKASPTYDGCQIEVNAGELYFLRSSIAPEFLVYYTGDPGIPNFDSEGTLVQIESDLWMFSIPEGISYIGLDFLTQGIAVNELYKECFFYGLYSLSTYKEVEQLKNKKIIGVGDSLTFRSNALASVLPDDWEYINCGWSGNTELEALARMGSIPMRIAAGFTIPAGTGTTAITIESTEGGELVDFWKNANGNDNINPVTIQGIEGTISYAGGTYYFARSIAGTSRDIISGSIIQTKHAKEYLKYPHIFFIGQNGHFEGGWAYVSDANHQTLIDRLWKAVNMLPHNNYLIICTHSRTTDALEAALIDSFGMRAIILREYLVNYGLEDAGIVPTADDLTEIAANRCPASLLDDYPTDLVHFNNDGYDVVANLKLRFLKALGIIK